MYKKCTQRVTLMIVIGCKGCESLTFQCYSLRKKYLVFVTIIIIINYDQEYYKL